jgi:uncharacterized protein (TIGR00369 family)
MRTAEDFQKRIERRFPGLLGIEIAEVTPAKVVASLLVRPELCNTGNSCHGGVYMTLADTVGGIGAVANLPPGTRTITVESKTNFLGAARANTRITAESIPLHRGRTTQVWQTTVRCEDGRLAAVVTQTQMVLPER